MPSGISLPTSVCRLLEGANGQIPQRMRLAFEGMIWDCAAEHGNEPAQRALRILARYLPRNPSALAAYFDPILRQEIRGWRVDQARERQLEASEAPAARQAPLFAPTGHDAADPESLERWAQRAARLRAKSTRGLQARPTRADLDAVRERMDRPKGGNTDALEQTGGEAHSSCSPRSGRKCDDQGD